MVGGAAQSIVDTPIEVAKTKLITSHTIPLKEVVKESMRFRGLGSTLSRNMLFAAIMNVGINYNRDAETSPKETFMRAGFSALIAATITQPLDYVKTQQQKVGGYHNVNFIKLLYDSGKKSALLLWTGLGSRVTLSITTMCVSATVFKFLTTFQQSQASQES